MNTTQERRFRDQLGQIAARLHGDAEAIADQARSPAGGQGSGDITNVPQHLGDMGTEEYLHDLNATLLENEEFLAEEVHDAIERLNQGTFGVCGLCHEPIPQERLHAVPYARYCVGCAEQLEAGLVVNYDAGRPNSPADTLSYDPDLGDASPVNPQEQPSSSSRGALADHAAGTPGGGTALGGLAGVTQGDGSPDDVELEELQETMGSGEFDAQDARSGDVDAKGSAAT